ncbi:MAG: thymidine phosphorylase [Oligoflexia bacterium]|nr:thymidine phosphorylase [Oligoflexia bacterium]
MIPAELIKIKRDGGRLTESEIADFVNGYVDGQVTDYQMSAFLMAVFFRGMTDKETWSLTRAMLKSGEVVDLHQVSGRKIDKHSTGGVGDKTSLILGPVVASCGVIVPMMSGRGLGHTGGTLDKLESLSGFNTQLTLVQFKEQINQLGLSFIGQTPSICPADKKMYALRDVTATVECIPLICASIMSKKLAEGIDGLVLDVKYGSGAFMKTAHEAKILASKLLSIAKLGKTKVTALITNMNIPLGRCIGNALEVQECLDVLSGSGPDDLKELSLELSAHMIVLGGKAKSLDQARRMATTSLENGSALQKFRSVVEAQGGSLNLPKSQFKEIFNSPKSGFLNHFEVESLGLASLSLGAGRRKTSDVIDPSAGLVLLKKYNDKVKKGEPLVEIHHNLRVESAQYNQALNYLNEAILIGPLKGPRQKLLHTVMK